jgi:predicted RNA-binding protein
MTNLKKETENMSRKLLTLLGVALLITILSISALLATKTSAASTATVSGKINTIDVGKKKINIKQTNGTSVTLNVAGSTKITRNGTRAALSGLVLGDSIKAQFNAKTHNAASMTAKGLKVSMASGKVKNAVKGTGVLTVGSKNLKTNAKTKFSRNGRVVSLSQVTRKDSVVVHTKAGTNNALDVLDDGPDESEVEGTITAVDTTAGTVTIIPSNGTPTVTLTVSTTTMIEVNDNPGTLTDLQVGMEADAEYDPTTMVAFSIEAQSPGENAEVTGTVAAVDLTNSTITISPTIGSSITLSVTAATEIQVNDEEATLADVQVGMPVKAEYDTLTLVAQQIDVGTGGTNDENNADVEGTVAMTTTTSVTINPEDNGPAITLTVDASTQFEINDAPGTIDQIPLGAQIEAEYDTTTLIASDLDVQTGDDRVSKAHH